MRIKVSESQLVIFILTTGLILNYVFDGVNKICSLYLPTFSRVAIIYRIFLQIFSILIIVIFFNKKRALWLLSFMYFLICFSAGNLHVKYYLGIEIDLLEQFVYYNKYFFIFFIFFATYKVLKDRNYLERFINIFKHIFVFNGVLSLVGLLFKTKMFLVTPESSAGRFGYDGLIISGNEASIFYLLGLFVFYYDWRFRKKPLYLLVLAVFFCFVTGMKAVILGILLLLFYHIFSTISLKKLTGIFLTIVLLTTVLVFSLPKLQDLFAYYYYFLENEGFAYMFTGGRNTLFESRVIPLLKEWDVLNYIIGGQNISNVENLLSLTEMDFVDVFLFFGVLNGVFFLVLYGKLIVGKINNRFYLYTILIFALLSFFAGHFFTSSVNPLYIILVFAYLKNFPHEYSKTT